MEALIDAGLIRPTVILTAISVPSEVADRFVAHLHVVDRVLRVERPAPETTGFAAIHFTSTGSELQRICAVSANMAYVNAYADVLRSAGFKVQISAPEQSAPR